MLWLLALNRPFGAKRHYAWRTRVRIGARTFLTAFARVWARMRIRANARIR